MFAVEQVLEGVSTGMELMMPVDGRVSGNEEFTWKERLLLMNAVIISKEDDDLNKNEDSDNKIAKEKKIFLILVLVIFIFAVFASYRVSYRLRTLDNTLKFYSELNEELDKQGID